MSFPTHRPRRLRRTEALRGLARETRLATSGLIYPMFPQPLHLPAFFHDLIDGLLINARHGTDFLANLAARADKHRINESGSAEASFAHEGTQDFAATQTPGTLGGKCHCVPARLEHCR